jgi:hypothetical protein
MTLRSFAVACAAGCLSLSSPAPAHEIPLNTGEGLIANCDYESSDQADAEHHLGLCLGFIKGVSNSYQAAHILDLCAPPSMDNEDLISAAVSRMKRLPDDILKASSAEILKYVLADAFACDDGAKVK